MKPFDLEAFRAGKPALTRHGHTATFAHYNPDAKPNYRLLGYVNGKAQSWSGTGRWCDDDGDCNIDLTHMAPEPEQWQLYDAHGFAVLCCTVNRPDIAVRFNNTEHTDPAVQAAARAFVEARGGVLTIEE
jgi:hypothetical protein